VVVGTKDSSGDAQRIATLCRKFPGFSVLVGTETLLLDTLREGAAGCISATVNVTSRLARRVHDAHQAGESDEAEALQRRLTELRALIEAYPMIPATRTGATSARRSPRWTRPTSKSSSPDWRSPSCSSLAGSGGEQLLKAGLVQDGDA
jgi:4-hydroxy-tetrahydrodipicolinate synthase